MRGDRRFILVFNRMKAALKQGGNLEVLATVALKAANLKLYQCSTCGKKFRNGFRLHEHLRSTKHLRPKTIQKG